MAYTKFKNFTYFILFYSIVVILLGAWIRISTQGTGCGNTWPLCERINETINVEQTNTWIELFHRVLYIILFIQVAIHFVLSVFKFNKIRRIRIYSFFVLILTLIKGVLNANMLFNNQLKLTDSLFQSFIVGFHQVTTLLITGLLFWMAKHIYYEFRSSNRNSKRNEIPNLKIVTQNQPMSLNHAEIEESHRRIPKFYILLFPLIAITGAWAALSNSTNPSSNSSNTLVYAIEEFSSILTRLRILHPSIAILLGGVISFYLYLQHFIGKDEQQKPKSVFAAILTASGIIFGIITLFMNSPVWMKMFHILFTYLIWIGLLNWAYSYKYKNL